MVVLLFFFKQKTAYEMRISDWSSDVCSSDLAALLAALVARTAAVQRQAQLLDGADDDLVGGIVRQHAPHQRAGVGVLLPAAFLEAVALLAGLAIEHLSVDHEPALPDGRVGLEQDGGRVCGSGRR